MAASLSTITPSSFTAGATSTFSVSGSKFLTDVVGYVLIGNGLEFKGGGSISSDTSAIGAFSSAIPAGTYTLHLESSSGEKSNGLPVTFKSSSTTTTPPVSTSKPVFTSASPNSIDAVDGAVTITFNGKGLDTVTSFSLVFDVVIPGVINTSQSSATTLVVTFQLKAKYRGTFAGSYTYNSGTTSIKTSVTNLVTINGEPSPEELVPIVTWITPNSFTSTDRGIVTSKFYGRNLGLVTRATMLVNGQSPTPIDINVVSDTELSASFEIYTSDYGLCPITLWYAVPNSSVVTSILITPTITLGGDKQPVTGGGGSGSSSTVVIIPAPEPEPEPEPAPEPPAPAPSPGEEPAPAPLPTPAPVPGTYDSILERIAVALEEIASHSKKMRELGEGDGIRWVRPHEVAGAGAEFSISVTNEAGEEIKSNVSMNSTEPVPTPAPTQAPTAAPTSEPTSSPT